MLYQGRWQKIFSNPTGYLVSPIHSQVLWWSWSLAGCNNSHNQVFQLRLSWVFPVCFLCLKSWTLHEVRLVSRGKPKKDYMLFMVRGTLCFSCVDREGRVYLTGTVHRSVVETCSLFWSLKHRSCLCRQWQRHAQVCVATKRLLFCAFEFQGFWNRFKHFLKFHLSLNPLIPPSLAPFLSHVYILISSFSLESYIV